MNQGWRQRMQAWRAGLPIGKSGSRRPLPPRWIAGALLVLAALLLEVWQQSAVASLSLRVGRAADQLKRASNELEWTRAELDRSATRAEVGTLAFSAGVRPGDQAQIVWLPADYLEDDGAGTAAPPPTLLAAAGRTLGALVPDAMARGRHVH
jgi:hypothetical protein